MRNYIKRVIIWIVMCGIVYAFWRWYSGLLMPFVLAVLLAVWLDPIVGKLEHWGLSRSLAALLAVISSILGLFVILTVLATVLVTELKQLLRTLPAVVTTIEQSLYGLVDKLGQVQQPFGPGPEGWQMQMQTVSRLVESILRMVANFLVHLPDTMLMLMVAVMAAFFIMRDKERVARHVVAWFPPPWRPYVASMRTDITSGTLGFLKAQLMLVSLTALGTMTGLLLLGLHYAVLIGIVAGVLDFIPYMGPTTILIPWALVQLVTGHPVTVAKIVIVMLAVALVRQIAEPRLVGQNMGLHPLVAILALYLGVQFFGASGFLVGPISAVIIKVMAQVFDPPALDSKS
ncbi:sporulation integral membrane protein YtvI [Sulfobacillus thermosulfidooxidans DSM 9293]|uniref:Sporulation integral membrane protein YtvI n=1 Tax=Sulfobacillus thermosulfidooxidans (strain DSM 9293 / VKM B-1269 / AT-1) TaxID=929705 RepID=A0A1W1WJT6_SULTA|nr:sporulation integral membrane protein YtvI [Sulfobacillus thermosulfidooxidans]SMC06574.1 sporulation integral membrane protein YtvI [Sulfobacillus thermosulfidooxidans DSM 9293]